MADAILTFDLRATQKIIIVEDNVNYNPLWPIAGVVGVISISGPSGNIYENTDFNSPDIEPSVSRFLNKTIELPLDPQTNYANILKGNYTLKVTWYNPTLDEELEFLDTFQYDFDIPEITNTTVSGPYSGTLISEDTTDYGDNVFSLSREHRIKYPTQLDPIPADIVSSDMVVIVNPIYTNQWTVQITTEIEYRNPDELRLLWNGSGEFTHYVYGSCISAMADVIDIMLSNYYNLVSPQSYNQEAYQKRLVIVNTAWHLLNLAYYQGDVEEADRQSYVIQEQVRYSGATLPGSSSSILVIPCPPWEGGVFPESTYVFQNGLTKTLDAVPIVKLGGVLTEDTSLTAGYYRFGVYGSYQSNVFSFTAVHNSGIWSKVSNGANEGRVLVQGDKVTVGLADLSTPASSRIYDFGTNGLVETADYRQSYTNRSLVAKDYVDENFLPVGDGTFYQFFEEKEVPVGDDIFLIQDSESNFETKYSKLSSYFPKTFTSLTDTFPSYTGLGGNAVVVNQTEDGLETYDLTQTYLHIPTASQIYNLTEKDNPHINDVLIIEDSQDGYAKKKINIGRLPGNEPAQAFTDLTDVPNSYTGFAGYVLLVNGTEDGIVFEQAGWVPITGGTYTGRVYFSTSNINSVVLKKSNATGTPGTPTASENYLDYQDGDGDTQGRSGIDSFGNMYLKSYVSGGKVYIDNNTYINGNTGTSGSVVIGGTTTTHSFEVVTGTVKLSTLNGYIYGTTGVLSASTTIPETAISFTDITTGDTSVIKHGFAPKLNNDVNSYLSGIGTWETLYSFFSLSDYSNAAYAQFIKPTTSIGLHLGYDSGYDSTLSKEQLFIASDSDVAGIAFYDQGTQGNHWSLGIGCTDISPTDFYIRKADSGAMLTLNQDGKVGIGKSNASTTFDDSSWVQVEASNNTFSFLSRNGNYRSAGIFHSSTEGGILYAYDGLTSSTVKVRLSAGGDSYFIGGDVGFGTSSPSNKVHITQSEHSPRALYIIKAGEEVISNSTNNSIVQSIYQNTNYNINSGVTDSGYRMGLDIISYVNSGLFLGTLAAQYGIRVQYGHATGSGTGTITNVYGINLAYNATGNSTVTNNYSIYSSGSGRMWHVGNMGVGVDPTSAKFQVTTTSGDSVIFDTNASISLITKYKRQGTEYGSIYNLSTGSDFYIRATSASGKLYLSGGGGSQQVTIDTAGKLGVGIASPVSNVHSYESNSTTGNGAGFTIEQGSTGDSLLHFLLTGGQRYLVGIDNSDSDKFKIGRGSDWANGVDFSISTTGVVSISNLTGYLKGASGALSAVASIPVSDGGTGLSTIGSSNHILGVNAAGTDLEYKALEGTNITVTHVTGEIYISIPQNVSTTSEVTFAKVTVTAAPLSGSDLANKSYVDSIASGFKPKQACRVATTGNGTIGSAFANGQTIDGVTLATNDRILIKDQSTGSQNGIYIVNAAGAPTRATDFDSWDAEVPGALVTITAGTTNANTTWVCNNTTGGTFDVTTVTFVLYSSGNVSGTTNRITVTSSVIDISANYVGQASITTLGTISTGSWNATAIPVSKGGTGSAYTKFTGPTATRTYTLPNATATLLYSGGALGTPSSGVATNLTGTATGLTAGAAAILSTARAIYGNNFDGSAALTQIIASTYGGTGNGFTKFSGPTTAEKVFILPDFNATLLYEMGPLGTPLSGDFSTGTFTWPATIDTDITGSAATLNTSRNIAITGDLTWNVNFDGSTNVTAAGTISNSSVSLAKMANVATATVFYRKTAGTGVPEVQTLATLKTDLGLTGTNSGDQTITLTGNVTGSGTGSFATTIANSAVTLAKMANVNTATVFYRKTAGTGVPEVQTLATLKTDLGLTGTNSGDQTSISGITGTKSQYNVSLTDGDFMFVGDAPTSHSHGSITNAGYFTSGGSLNFNSTSTVTATLFGDATTGYKTKTINIGTGGAIYSNTIIRLGATGTVSNSLYFSGMGVGFLKTDANGLVTRNNYTTLAGFGITDAYTKTYVDANFQPLSGYLTALVAAGFAAGAGLVRYNDNSWTLDDTVYAASGHSITSHGATAWRMFYSNATTTAIQQLAFGAAGTVLKSNGATSTPSFAVLTPNEVIKAFQSVSISGTYNWDIAANPNIYDDTIGSGTVTINVTSAGLDGMSGMLRFATSGTATTLVLQYNGSTTNVKVDSGASLVLDVSSEYFLTFVNAGGKYRFNLAKYVAV